MKKRNQKGFMLAETLIVSTFILGALVFLFVQFRNVNTSYQTAFQYNTAEALYAAENMKKFYLQDHFETLLTHYLENAQPYAILTDCPSDYVEERRYCQLLKENLEIKTILFTYMDLTRIKASLENNTEIEPAMKKFISYISDEDMEGYRLIVEMTNGTFATIKLSN